MIVGKSQACHSVSVKFPMYSATGRRGPFLFAVLPAASSVSKWLVLGLAAGGGRKNARCLLIATEPHAVPVVSLVMSVTAEAAPDLATM